MKLLLSKNRPVGRDHFGRKGACWLSAVQAEDKRMARILQKRWDRKSKMKKERRIEKHNVHKYGEMLRLASAP